ncbi:MAG: YceI family protein [Nitrospirota bacterium]|nr:YceI family protein [Nitrospirota bacterium]
MKKVILLLIALLAFTTTAFAAESYTVDPKHTFANFEVNHLGLTTQRGRFDKTSGKITLDLAAKKATVDIEIDAKSVNTGGEQLEKHLLGEDFFNVEKFPTITFKSTNVEFKNDYPTSVHGNLTILGVTKPVTLAITAFNCRVHPMNKKYVCGADATATVNRSEFGMTYAVPAVSDAVKLLITVEAFKD